MSFTLAVTGRMPDAEGDERKDTYLIFIDIKAHFWSPARRRLFGRAARRYGLSSRESWSIEEELVWDERCSRELGGGDQGGHAFRWVLAG